MQGTFTTRSGGEHGDGGNDAGVDDRDFASVAGGVLRDVREARGLSLRQVTVRSGGRFKASSVASYERGDRQISLERLFALCGVYGVAPENVVATIALRLDDAVGELQSRSTAR